MSYFEGHREATNEGGHICQGLVKKSGLGGSRAIDLHTPCRPNEAGIPEQEIEVPCSACYAKRIKSNCYKQNK